MTLTRSDYLLELSQELTRFQLECRGHFRCPTCLRDYPITSTQITEEHIIPDSSGGKVTTFLCNRCNSFFGSKQTRWLSDWIDLIEGGAPFHTDPKKQRASVSRGGNSIAAKVSLADNGAIKVIPDRTRSDPKQYDAYLSAAASELSLEVKIPVFAHERALRVGFLTAAYGLWFKHFGYSFVLQRCLEPVRNQILRPEDDVIDWDFLIEVPHRRSLEPELGLMRFGSDVFPVAVIYDHIVILPSAKKLQPSTADPKAISGKLMNLGPPIAQRFQGRCVGPAVVLCDFQILIEPDIVERAAVSPQYILLDGW